MTNLYWKPGPVRAEHKKQVLETLLSLHDAAQAPGQQGREWASRRQIQNLAFGTDLWGADHAMACLWYWLELGFVERASRGGGRVLYRASAKAVEHRADAAVFAVECEA